MNRIWKKAAPVLLGFIVLAGTQNSFAAYTIVDLGNIEKEVGSATLATSVNSGGSVVGWSLGPGGEGGRSFLWHDGVMTEFAPGGQAFDINDRGQIVGTAFFDQGYVQAFLFEDGIMTRLATPDGSTASYATGISDNGDIVGFFWDTTQPLTPTVPCIWRDGEVFRLDTPYPAGAFGVAINNRGEVAGYSTDGAHAFIWARGTMTDLGSLGGGRNIAEDINDLGRVVGSSKTAAGAVHAFVWRDGTMTDLGTLGGNSAHAYGINNQGQIVGVSETAEGLGRAFLWEGGVMLDLGALEGSDVSVANKINERGWIVGYSAFGQDSVHAVLWLPGSEAPAPTASRAASSPTSRASSPTPAAVVSRRGGSAVSLSFVAPHAGNATIRLFDVSGRLVREVWRARSVSAGRQEVLIEGRDASGIPLPSGVYFYRAEMLDWSLSGKVLITK